MKPKKTIKSSSNEKAVPKVKNYLNDPFFVKKFEEAQRYIDKYGLPKELLEDKE